MTFKTGDRVRVLTSVPSDLRPGEVGIVKVVSKKGTFPVQVTFEDEATPEHYAHDELELVGGTRGRKLTVTQNGSTVTFEGDFDFEVEDLDAFVQVRIPGSGYQRLTYRDPAGSLTVGDRVLVPFGYSNRERTGEVIALGRGNYEGATKDVIARLNREELVAA